MWKYVRSFLDVLLSESVLFLIWKHFISCVEVCYLLSESMLSLVWKYVISSRLFPPQKQCPAPETVSRPRNSVHAVDRIIFRVYALVRKYFISFLKVFYVWKYVIFFLEVYYILSGSMSSLVWNYVISCLEVCYLWSGNMLSLVWKYVSSCVEIYMCYLFSRSTLSLF